ncbi:uncharacterized protein LOC122951675 [Acropora millepora]|uniref:uncharacterized protein LOC122951675 n=1 Tax=Acropora millepora TaxID=45264 RepID=UPI001CF2F5E2|nr:uncharacterized protein LOC122951675 [Acropora millepora]
MQICAGLQGKDSPVLKAKLINLVHSKDPSSPQFDSSQSPESTKALPVEFEPEIATKEVGVKKDLPPDFVMADSTENVSSEGLRLPVITKSPPSLVEANNSNIYQGRPRGAGVQRNSDHPPNSKIVADLEGIKLDLLILQKQVEGNSRALSKNSQNQEKALNGELSEYKLRCEKLQAIVLVKDKDIKELEAKIFSLETRAMAVEDENKSLKLAMKILMHENGTEISRKGGKDDRRDNFCQVKAKKHKNQPYRKCQLNTNELRGSPVLTQNRVQSLENTTETEIQRGQIINNTRHTTIVAGDSILKNLRGHKMSKVSQVKVSTFSGCTTKDMYDHVKPILRKKPDRRTIHVGTNSLRECSSPTACAQEIIDLLPEMEASNARKLKVMFDVYGLHQLIANPTRVTPFPQTLIDLCITNSPLSIVKSGVMQLSSSDHALVYMTRKARYDRCGARIIQARCMKSFNESEFLEDLKQKAWNDSSHNEQLFTEVERLVSGTQQLILLALVIIRPVSSDETDFIRDSNKMCEGT